MVPESCASSGSSRGKTTGKQRAEYRCPHALVKVTELLRRRCVLGSYISGSLANDQPVAGVGGLDLGSRSIEAIPSSHQALLSMRSGAPSRSGHSPTYPFWSIVGAKGRQHIPQLSYFCCYLVGASRLLDASSACSPKLVVDGGCSEVCASLTSRYTQRRTLAL